MNYGIYKFLRNRDVVQRRVRINQIERLTRDKPYLYHYSVREVTSILNKSGIDVGEATIRRWIKIQLVHGFKKSRRKNARWWMIKIHLLELQKRMHMMSEALERHRETQKTRVRYVDIDKHPQERDRHGRFVGKETVYDHRHSHMAPRIA